MTGRWHVVGFVALVSLSLTLTASIRVGATSPQPKKSKSKKTSLSQGSLRELVKENATALFGTEVKLNGDRFVLAFGD